MAFFGGFWWKKSTIQKVTKYQIPEINGSGEKMKNGKKKVENGKMAMTSKLNSSQMYKKKAKLIIKCN